jgi:cytochrome b
MTLQDSTQGAGGQAGSITHAVWDWPVRLFHWTLVALLAAAWATAEAGIDYMHWHMRCGYALLTLLLFRVLWGVVGTASARFGSFVRGPRAVWAYARAWFSRRPQHYLGHNPLGGWMVLVLLLLVAVQAGTGLFANDDIVNEGPLARLVSTDTSGLLTAIHKINFNLLLTAVGLHVAAVLLYLVRGENLLKAMFTGRKPAGEYEDADRHRPGPMAPAWRAALCLAVAAGAVWALITLPA